MYSKSMCAIQINKMDLRPTAYYTITNAQNLRLLMGSMG